MRPSPSAGFRSPKTRWLPSPYRSLRPAETRDVLVMVSSLGRAMVLSPVDRSAPVDSRAHKGWRGGCYGAACVVTGTSEDLEGEDRDHGYTEDPESQHLEGLRILMAADMCWHGHMRWILSGQ